MQSAWSLGRQWSPWTESDTNETRTPLNTLNLSEINHQLYTIFLTTNQFEKEQRSNDLKIAEFVKRANAFYIVPASDESSQAIFSSH